MSVILEHEFINGSYLTGNKLVLEPINLPNETLPFIDSRILKPHLFQTGILQLNQVLMAHPGVSLNRIYDPIVNVTENHIDFEGFARFGHSFCKIRFPETLFEGGIREEGMTNVDFNPNFIIGLRNRRYSQNLWLYIDPLGEISDKYKKVVLSGNAFQHLIEELGFNYTLSNEGVRALLWDERAVKLVFSKRSEKDVPVSSVKLIKPSNEPIKSWGIWRIQNLLGFAEHIVQADVYLAKKLPSFWVLHARSGVEMLLGYTSHTNALWTETARGEVERLLKNPHADIFVRRRRRTRRKSKIIYRENFVETHPGQKIIPEFVQN